ncbi:MAG: 50S ribosomal protein L9 [Planctomycetota bacterium]|nr:MAG: 50S ribosomal protein L9 [Planctomycetota bacterium]
MKAKLLLCKNVDKLGIVGDVVEVAPGYARNYLIPRGLATEPTEANIRALAEARKIAEQERRRHLEAMAELAKEVDGQEITIRAKANEDGVLYGSVGRMEIAAALEQEGFPVTPDHVILRTPIRHLDNVSVDLRFGDEAQAQIKVWVVREREEGEEEDAEAGAEAASAEPTGREAGADDHRADE